MGLTLYALPSSARDKITSHTVAIKKISQPFSRREVAKRTYREVKLLKHLVHENVSGTNVRNSSITNAVQIISLNDIFLSPREDMQVSM